MLEDASQPVVLPVVLKVALDLRSKRLGERLVPSESGEKSHPVPQLWLLVDDSYLLLIVAQNFDEGAHNVREESDTANHVEDGRDDFDV